jgi:hypothetical protein
MSVLLMFVEEANRLAKEKKFEAAIVSIKNALACQECKWSYQIELRRIIAEIEKEIERGKRRD